MAPLEEALVLFFRMSILSGYTILILGAIKALISNAKEKNLQSKVPDSLNDNEARESSINLVLIIAVLFFILIISQIKINYSLGNGPSDAVLILLGILPVILGALFILYQISPKLQQKSKIIKIQNDETKQMLDIKDVTYLKVNSDKKIDTQRKFFHIIIFLGIALSLFIGYGVLAIMIQNPSNPNYAYYLNFFNNFWGSMENLDYLTEVFVFGSFSATKSIIVILFCMLVMILLTTELTRVSYKYRFPMHKFIEKNLRTNERNCFASYTYFICGMTFSAMMLPSLMFLAVLSIIAFGDSAASTIGMRFGKHRFKHNNKSWEGTIAGSISSFIPVFLFTGPVYAVVATIAFVLIDIFCPKPVKASDNILVPVSVTALFILLSAFIPAVSVFGF